MTYDEFMELRTDQRDARLAEFLNQRGGKDGSSPDIKFFDMRVTFRKIPAGNEYSGISWMQHQGKNVATARYRDGEWFPSNTVLDTAREFAMNVRTALFTVEHAKVVVRQQRVKVEAILTEINFRPVMGDRVMCLATPFYGDHGIITEIFEAPVANPNRPPIYDIAIVDGEGNRIGTVTTAHVLPPIPDPKASAHVG